jgi:peptidyl-tRNA hydrolase
MDSADFVLAKFNDEEQNNLPDLTNEVTAFLNEYIFGGTFPQETRKVIF